MKNTVWAFAAKNLSDSIEDYGVALASHFVNDFDAVTKAEIALEEHLWQRVKIRDRLDPYAFTAGGPELRNSRVTASGKDITINSGFSGLPILKTHGSAFEEFTRDKYTTLWEAPDRLLATEITASWRYMAAEADFNNIWEGARLCYLRPFGIKNDEVFFPVIDPHGTIEGTIRRTDTP
jgi:urate oxidase